MGMGVDDEQPEEPPFLNEIVKVDPEIAVKLITKEL